MTVESLASIMASGFKDVDGKLVKIQKAVDGVEWIVSTHAEKFNNMADLRAIQSCCQLKSGLRI